MATEGMIWAIDNLIALSKDPNQRRGICSVREMLWDFDEDDWARMSEEERDVWVSEYLKSEPVAVVEDHSAVSEVADAYTLAEQIAALENLPSYQVAADMAYMQRHIELEEPLSLETYFTLATKLNEASASYFCEPLLHEEYLDAIRYLIEYGINEGHSPELPSLSPKDTLKLLLAADNQVFGTLIEIAAINNREHYNELNHHQEIEIVTAAIEVIQNHKAPLCEVISSAQEKTSAQKAEQNQMQPIMQR